MSSLIDDTGSIGQAPDVAARHFVEASPNTTELFQGDIGTLRGETRRCLVALLSGPSVDGRRQAALWQILLRDRRELQSRLHDLFLDLVVDTEQQVAFVRQVPGDDDDDIPILLRRHQLTFIDSALVLFLRHRLTEADSANERAVVSLQEMLDHLSIFDKVDNADRVKFDKQRASAVERCKQLNLIRPIRASDSRFEVSPTLKLLFGAEEIQALTEAYASLKTTPLRAEDAGLDTAGAADSDLDSSLDIEGSHGED